MSPPQWNLSAHIGTNYIPSEEDITHIKNFILPGPTAKIAELGIEIARVEDILLRLMEQRQDLMEEIMGYHNLISPARRLPTDVLREIFAHTLPETQNASMGPSECPMILTRICSGWRSIALSTPRLWSTIHIPIPAIAGGSLFQLRPKRFPDLSDELRISSLSSFKNYATAVANWLGKSGVTPLSISLHDPRHTFVPEEHYEVILDSILPFSNRWKYLILDTYSPFISRIAELTEYDVPLLESLTLREITAVVGNPNNNPQLSWKTSGLAKAPRLQKIDYTPIIDNISHLPFKWRQLTDLKLSQTSGASAKVTLSDLILVLSLSAHLVKFHSEIRLLPSCDFFPATSRASLSLLSLQKMVFHDNGVDCRALFDLLEVPSLLHLEFIPTNPSSSTIVLSFLPQISGTIISFSTLNYFFVNPGYLLVLSQCQKLTSIIIKSVPSSFESFFSSPGPPARGDSINDTLLENLTLSIDHPNRLAPALEVFECQTNESFSEAGVLRFIKAKQSRTDLANLKRISIRLTGPRGVDILLDEELAQYVKRGLIVDLRYPEKPRSDGPFAFASNAGIKNHR